MLREDLLVLEMTANDAKNFIGFGYIAKPDLEYSNDKTTFNNGYIYRFAIFCTELGEISIKSIKKHYYTKGQYKSYYKLAHKLEDSKQYTEYLCNEYDYPKLDKDTILRHRRY